jgi:hypothetical protein
MSQLPKFATPVVLRSSLRTRERSAYSCRLVLPSIAVDAPLVEESHV